VLFALHVGAYTRSGTQLSGKINIVPQAGALAIAPVTVTTIFHITKRDGMHEEPIF
jgi:hypothetical protein